MKSISARELSEMLKRGDDFLLLDVRNQDEYDFAKIEGAKLLPMPELEERLEELDKSRKTVVFCHAGGRSSKAVKLMEEEGFRDVINLAGGITSWSDTVDPSVPKY